MSTFTIAIAEITYDDATRQRKDLGDVESLAESIRRLGLINAIVLDEENNLLAGRRRLEACRRLGYSTVLARRYGDLNPADKRLLELDENLRRLDLPWQETVAAIWELHGIKCLGDENWDQEKTAEYAGLHSGHVSKAILVAKALEKKDEKVLACRTLEQAADLIRRRRKMVLDTALSKGFEEADFDFGESPAPLPLGNGLDLPEPVLVNPLHLPPAANPYKIQCTDFLSWIDTQTYPRYNLLHCDFPYGLNMEKSVSANSAASDTQYDDSEDLFWKLTTALVGSQDRFVLSSAHMIFWFSMKYYDDVKFMLEEAGWFVIPHPLIWHKTDGAGIASDYRRRPKHTYETALFCSRGDRFISQLKNDIFGVGIAKHTEGHLSAKPLEMVEYFLSMVCTEESDVLDPTCGSGTAIRAAMNLGANSALGLEINPETAEAAQQRLLRHGNS